MKHQIKAGNAADYMFNTASHRSEKSTGRPGTSGLPFRGQHEGQNKTHMADYTPIVSTRIKTADPNSSARGRFRNKSEVRQAESHRGGMMSTAPTNITGSEKNFRSQSHIGNKDKKMMSVKEMIHLSLNKKVGSIKGYNPFVHVLPYEVPNMAQQKAALKCFVDIEVKRKAWVPSFKYNVATDWR